MSCTTTSVEEFLATNICVTGEIDIEELAIRSTISKVYKVGFDSDFENEFKNAGNWPANIKVEKYSFLAERLRNERKEKRTI